MNKKIIIITGCVASGKTTFSHALSQKLRIPCFEKDAIKVQLGKTILQKNGKELSKVAFKAMEYMMNEFMKFGLPLIVEGPFNNVNKRGKENEEKILRFLIEKYNYNSLSFVFYGDLNILYNRFIQRDQSSDRDRILCVNGLFDDIRFFKKINTPLNDFTVGQAVIKVDTSEFQSVDFAKLIDLAYSFINQ